MIENLTPSDLIYLYLDGEATTMQQTTLFAALATDADLQEEFNEALSMNKAFEHERATAQPPSYLTAQVFATNGITQAAAGSAITATLWLWMRKFGIPTATTLVGAAIMYLALQWNWNGANSAAQQAQTPAVSTPVVSVPPALAFAKEEISNSQPTQRNDMPGVGVQDAPKFPRRIPRAVTESASPSQVSETEQNTPDVAVADWSGGYRSEELPISNVELYRSSNQGNGRLYGISKLGESGFITPSENNTILQVNNPVSASLYSKSSTGSSINTFKNVSLTVLPIHLDENNAIGLQFSGSTKVILSDFVGDEFVENPTYTTFGFVHQYQAMGADVLGGEPFVRTSLNVTTNGNFMPSLVSGISYSLFSTFRLNMGLEASGFIYSSRGQSKIEPMLGLTTAVSWSF